MRLSTIIFSLALGSLSLLNLSCRDKTQVRAIAVNPASTEPIIQEARVALVIGNGAYRTAPLKNTTNDARAMADALKDVGFTVVLLVDADRRQMFDAVKAFGARIREGGVGLFYYAGHGMQVKGTNYLIPVGANLSAEDELPVEALDMSAVLAKMDTAKNRLNIVILDACRNNPFARSFRSESNGLALMDAPTGTFVAFATAPGSVANDGDGQNGLYTQYLLRALKQPGFSVEQVFKQVRVGVKEASNGQQIPWDSSSLTGEFYFRPGTVASTSAPSAPTGNPFPNIVVDNTPTALATPKTATSQVAKSKSDEGITVSEEPSQSAIRKGIEFFGFREGMTITEMKNVAKQYSMPEPCCIDIDGRSLGFDSKTNSKSQYITFGPPQPIDPNHDVYNFYTAPPVGLYNGYNQEVNIGYSPKYKVVSVCLSFARTDTGTAKRIIDIIYNNVKKGFYGECKTSRVKGITDQTIIKSKNVEIIIDRIDGSKPQTDLERVYGTVTISFCCNFAKLKKAYDETDPLVIH